MRRCAIIYALLCALAAVSCKKMPGQHAEAIEFVSPQIHTKSELITDKTQMKSGDEELAYGVFGARYVPGDDGKITKHEQFIDNLKVSSDLSGDTWNYTGNRYYWSPGAVHKFFAVYPYYNDDHDDTTHEDDAYDLGISYEINDAKHALQVTGKHVVPGEANQLIICTGTDANGKNHLTPDILYGVSKYSDPYKVGENRGPVVFNMSHAFAAVTFRFRNATDDTISSIHTYTDLDNPTSSSRINMKLTGLKNAADHVFLSEDGAEWSEEMYSLPDHDFVVPKVNNMINPGSFYPVGDGTGTPTDWYTALVIPQDFAKEDPSFTFFVDMGTGGEKKYKINLKDYPVHAVADKAYTVLPGERYIYTFNVTANKVLCDLSIVPWIEDEPIHLN